MLFYILIISLYSVGYDKFKPLEERKDVRFSELNIVQVFPRYYGITSCPNFPNFRIIHHLGLARWGRYTHFAPSKFFLDSCGEFVPSTISQSILQESLPHKTFYQRSRDVIADILINSYFMDEKYVNSIFRQQFGPSFPSLETLKYNV